jgi:hypothetical protein
MSLGSRNHQENQPFIQRAAAARISLNTLVRLNDVVVEKFKKSMVLLSRNKNITIDSSGLGIRRRRRRKSLWYSIRTHSNPSKKREKERLSQTPSGMRMQGKGEANLLNGCLHPLYVMTRPNSELS